MMCHVNSYLRLGRQDICPFELFRTLHDPDDSIIKKLGMTRIEPNEIILTPKLFQNI